MSEENNVIRKQLIKFLRGGHAHASFEEAVASFPTNKINEQAPNSTYTPYRLLEHIRITQWDILDFIRNPNYKYMEWPKDYWPPKGKKATKAGWQKTIRDFKRDLAELIKIVQSPKTDLYRKIPHGEGQTILREALLVIDHNTYHIGEFCILREVMQTWGKKR